MILGALFIVAVAVELFLFLGKDYLLDTRRRAALEASLRQSYIDLQEAKRRIEVERAGLIAAIDEADRQRAALSEADAAFARSQKIMPDLIHTLGERNSGIRFRAPLTKQLPATPEASQKLMWSCRNFLDVWASDANAARQTAEKQFQAKQDYEIGEFAAMPSAPVFEPEEAQEKAA
ncbi:MAG TPA: hypothetical protein VMH36_09155 [Alphaproteobacteria bacterium]|nr:hypothetical protein [Alphaproteobacteria bacterium]